MENSFRSVLSEAIFNSRAPPGWHAESAGVQAGQGIAPSVEGLLREIGIKLERKHPLQVDTAMIARASRVVTFGCFDRCPIGAEAKSEDWNFPGSTGKSWERLRRIRDGLAERVDDLIIRIRKGEIK